MLAKGIKTKDESGGREYPGGLVINGSPTQETSPAVPSLPSGLGQPIAVIQVSPQSGSSGATNAAALCSLRPGLGSVFSTGESREMPSKVAPSSPMHSPVCRANATTTSMLFRRSSNAVALRVCIPATHPRSLSWHYHFRLLKPSMPLALLSVSYLRPTRTRWSQGVNRAQSISGFCLWNHGKPRTKLYECIGMTSTTDLNTCAR